MLSYLIFLCFIIVSHGNPVDKIEGNTNAAQPASINTLNNDIKNNNLTDGSDGEKFKHKNITVASEGELILSNINMPNSLLKDDQRIPLNSGVDVSSNGVKARKGVTLDETMNLSEEQNSQVSNSTSSNLQPSQSISTVNPNATTHSIPQGKPSILSAELIGKSDLLNKDPALDGSEDRLVKIHKISSDGRQAMIMPIVITVLVVPLFAVIGYMALQRGQEAWKNRHYKRMDFLLDGMYND